MLRSQRPPKFMVANYKEAFGVVSFRPLKSKKHPRNASKQFVEGISTASAQALRAWWQGALRSRKLAQGLPLRPHCMHGGTDSWPDWVASDFVAELAGVSVHEAIHWLSKELKLKKKHFRVDVSFVDQEHSKSKVFYFIGGFRLEPIDT